MDIEDIKKAKLDPGEVLILRSDQPVSYETAKSIKEYLNSAFPDNKVIILDKGLSLEKISLIDAHEIKNKLDDLLSEKG